uniref:E3 ubiquitin-protein ligase RMA n=1 Tax=Cicer arietinum TaxID=3827 RepID=A0A3Q7YH52_CICAR|nr:E3 ubiquitin-protein ligase RNF185-like isoform X2 [Cicer arietinum]
MSSGFGESTRSFPPNPSCSSGNNPNNDAGDFECNICFDLAQDPVITLCGHLFCWPCLYRWLHHHSHSQECPVCKALVVEEKLVPLYGRGKSQTDPRTKSYPGMEIPRRPSGQRPQTAPPPPPPEANYAGFGLMGGFIPMATARFGNFTLSTAFGNWASAAAGGQCFEESAFADWCFCPSHSYLCYVMSFSNKLSLFFYFF